MFSPLAYLGDALSHFVLLAFLLAGADLKWIVAAFLLLRIFAELASAMVATAQFAVRRVAAND